MWMATSIRSTTKRPTAASRVLVISTAHGTARQYLSQREANANSTSHVRVERQDTQRGVRCDGSPHAGADGGIGIEEPDVDVVDAVSDAD